MSETAIMREIKDTLNRTGRCRLIRYSVGFDAINKVRYGSPGAPDLCGILRNGKAFCIECKSEEGRMSANQLAWWMAARKWNVRGGVAKTVEEAFALLTEAEGQA